MTFSLRLIYKRTSCAWLQEITPKIKSPWSILLLFCSGMEYIHTVDKGVYLPTTSQWKKKKKKKKKKKIFYPINIFLRMSVKCALIFFKMDKRTTL